MKAKWNLYKQKRSNKKHTTGKRQLFIKYKEHLITTEEKSQHLNIKMGKICGYTDYQKQFLNKKGILSAI